MLHRHEALDSAWCAPQVGTERIFVTLPNRCQAILGEFEEAGSEAGCIFDWRQARLSLGTKMVLWINKVMPRLDIHHVFSRRQGTPGSKDGNSG
jgi:hypothetical protein